MNRITRVCLLGRNRSNIPIFDQRVVTVPKHVFVQFSIVADKNKVIRKTEISKEKSRKSLQELRSTFLRDFYDGALKNPEALQKDSVLNDVLSSLTSLSPPEIITILKLLAEKKKRPLPSIQTLCGILGKQEDWEITMQECTDLLFCLSNLSYKDEKLMALIVDSLKHCHDYSTPKIAASILFYLADLKHRDPELIDKLLKYILRKQFTTRPALNCLKACAVLNYSSPELEIMIQNLAQLEEVDFMQSTDFINFIWSCIILRKEDLMNINHMKKALSESYITRLICSGLKNPIKWKILNINAAARQMPSYDGPTLNNCSFFKVLSLSVPNQKSSFLNSVMDTLGHLFPEHGTIKPLVNTGSGFHIDIEYSAHNRTAETKRPNKGADGGVKMAVMLLNYSDICSDDTLTGIADFRLNAVKNMGYKLVPVRYSQYKNEDTLHLKISALRNLIQKFVPEALVLGNTSKARQGKTGKDDKKSK